MQTTCGRTLHNYLNVKAPTFVFVTTPPLGNYVLGFGSPAKMGNTSYHLKYV